MVNIDKCKTSKRFKKSCEFVSESRWHYYAEQNQTHCQKLFSQQWGALHHIHVSIYFNMDKVVVTNDLVKLSFWIMEKQKQKLMSNMECIW